MLKITVIFYTNVNIIQKERDLPGRPRHGWVDSTEIDVT
jgi:hypothetical protein